MIFNKYPIVQRVSLTLDDVRKYDLSEDYAKTDDTNYSEFVEEFGDIAVELDALPPKVLRQKVEDAILKYLDKPQFIADSEAEKQDLVKINELIKRDN